jgi:hypothetical protein
VTFQSKWRTDHTQHNHHPTGHAIPQRWITCRQPPSVFNRTEQHHSTSPPRPCCTLRNSNPSHATTTPARITGTTNTYSYDHRQQGNMFLQDHYHSQLGHCSTITLSRYR